MPGPVCKTIICGLKAAELATATSDLAAVAASDPTKGPSDQWMDEAVELLTPFIEKMEAKLGELLP